MLSRRCRLGGVMDVGSRSHYADRRRFIGIVASGALGAALHLSHSLAQAAAQKTAASSARFLGDLKLKQIEVDGRVLFELLDDFAYIDPTGLRWQAKSGLKTDGASIPRVFWPIVGQPVGDQYLKAAVIHDYYCSKHYREWQRVHRVFYDGMLTGGVSRLRACLMYFAVWRFGPRWDVKDILSCTPSPTEFCNESKPVEFKITIHDVVEGSYSEDEEKRRLTEVQRRLEAGEITEQDIPDVEAGYPSLVRDAQLSSVDANTEDGWLFAHPYQFPLKRPPQ